MIFGLYDIIQPGYVPTHDVDYKKHPATLHLEAIITSLDALIKQDPGAKSMRLSNLQEDLLELDCDIFIWSLDDNFEEPLPEDMQLRLEDVVATAKRLGVYPDAK